MEVGIVGLPNAGKSTLFNALTLAHAPVASYPFTTVDPNIGVTVVPDERLKKVAQITNCSKVTPATIKFVDVAGLVKGASRGEGLGNQFLSQIRAVDVLLHVVRCFAEAKVPHVDGVVHPLVDIETIDTELILADLEVLGRRLAKIEKKAKSGDKEAQAELAVLEKVKQGLEKGVAVRLLELTLEEKEKLSNVDLLTSKSLIIVANISEEMIGKEEESLKELKKKAEAEKAVFLALPAKLEAELAELDEGEKKTFLEELGLKESRLPALIRACFKLLNLIVFFTTESNECRAWPIPYGTKAAQAAGKIHTDMERGFIRAEVVKYEDLVEAGSIKRARELGHYFIEGREYQVQDGDVIYFHFRA